MLSVHISPGPQEAALTKPNGGGPVGMPIGKFDMLNLDPSASILIQYNASTGAFTASLDPSITTIQSISDKTLLTPDDKLGPKGGNRKVRCKYIRGTIGWLTMYISRLLLGISGWRKRRAGGGRSLKPVGLFEHDRGGWVAVAGTQTYLLRLLEVLGFNEVICFCRKRLFLSLETPTTHATGCQRGFCT